MVTSHSAIGEHISDIYTFMDQDWVKIFANDADNYNGKAFSKVLINKKQLPSTNLEVRV